LRELLALFSRYHVPMKQLAQFETTRNRIWFTRLERTGSRACGAADGL
jgi:hypothetical protein